MSTPFYLSYGALWILVIVQGLILLGLVRMVYQLQQSATQTGSSGEGMTAGEEAPAFSAVSLSGTPISSADLAGHLTALLFVSPNCQPCTVVLEDDMQYLNHKAQGNVIVICRSGREDCAQLAEQHELDLPIVADEDDSLTRLYRISTVPTVVLINADNRIQSYGQPDREELAEVFDKASVLEAEGVRKHHDDNKHN